MHRLPLKIKNREHRFEGKAVLSAAEALREIAFSVAGFSPQTDIMKMADARFDKFPVIGPESNFIEAYNEIETDGAGGLVARLIAGKAEKLFELASVRFPKNSATAQEPPVDRVAALEGVCFRVDSAKLHEELVPNIGAFFLSEHGAAGKFIVPDDADSRPPGSPLALAAGFHATRAWVMRFRGAEALPSGFERRTICNPAEPGKEYYLKIFPVFGKEPTFDIRIYDMRGAVCETVTGLRLRTPGARDSISGPAERDDGLANIRKHVADMCVIELETVSEFAGNSLSEKEAARTGRMIERRKISYNAARLACKTLSRRMSDDFATPATSITTVNDDGVRPRCPNTLGNADFPCSVSHDSRFAVAAVSNEKIGIDVEKISKRVLKSKRLYMSESERELAEKSQIGEVETCMRVWSVKECAVKAMNINFGQSCKRVRTPEVGMNRSRVLIDGGEYIAYHDTIDGHLFTVMNLKRRVRTMDGKTLKEFDLFSQVAGEQLSEIAGKSEILEFDADSVIFKFEDNAEKLYGVLEGEIELSVLFEDVVLKTDVQYEESIVVKKEITRKPIIVDFIGPYEVFGWSSLVPPRTYTSTARCTEKTRIFSIPATELEKIMQSDIATGYPIMKKLTETAGRRMRRLSANLIEAWGQAFGVNEM